MVETKNDATKKETKKKDRDGLSIIVGGIFILVLVFATYNYFNKGGEKKEENEKGADFIESIFSNKEGDINGEGIKEEAEEKSLETKTTEQAQETESVWVATDYKEGDIKGESYTVVRGDTLWEIAEAKYGSGFEWIKILEANKNSIGFLPNGSQALIIPGQVLILP